MELAQLRDLIDTTPGPTDSEIDPKARAWLAGYGTNLESGTEPAVLVVLAVDEDSDISIFAIPADAVDAAAHTQLAAVSRAAFEWHFTADLMPEQHPGALRILSGASKEPELIGELIEDLRDEFEDSIDEATLAALTGSAGSWNAFRVQDGSTVGSISHVYSANLCM